MKNIFLLSILVLLFGCQENAKIENRSSEEGALRFSDTIEVDYNRRVELLPEVKQEVNQWLAYVTAQNEIKRLRTATAGEIIESSRPLLQIMERLESSLPENLQSTAVEARANVLLTKSRVLHQLCNKKNKDPEEIFEVTRNVIVEFDNFKLQLNELFLKTPDEFEFELDEEFEEAVQERDTIERNLSQNRK